MNRNSQARCAAFPLSPACGGEGRGFAARASGGEGARGNEPPVHLQPPSPQPSPACGRGGCKPAELIERFWMFADTADWQHNDAINRKSDATPAACLPSPACGRGGCKPAELMERFWVFAYAADWQRDDAMNRKSPAPPAAFLPSPASGGGAGGEGRGFAARASGGEGTRGNEPPAHLQPPSPQPSPACGRGGCKPDQLMERFWIFANAADWQRDAAMNQKSPATPAAFLPSPASGGGVGGEGRGFAACASGGEGTRGNEPPVHLHPPLTPTLSRLRERGPHVTLFMGNAR